MEEKKYDVMRTMNGDYRTTFTKKYRARRPWQAANPKHILSFMPGTVLEISVKPGDKVRTGDQLALFKAMKMDNRILAPMDGEIAAVHVAPGVNIAKNVLMIEMK